MFLRQGTCTVSRGDSGIRFLADGRQLVIVASGRHTTHSSLVPKTEELIATPYRHGDRESADSFFLNGMTRAMRILAAQAHPQPPVTIYYAFKQSDTGKGGDTSSTGWETFCAVANGPVIGRRIVSMTFATRKPLMERGGPFVAKLTLYVRNRWRQSPCHKFTRSGMTRPPYASQLRSPSL